MKLFDHEMFFKQFRMPPTNLEELLQWVAPRIVKSNLKRESISPEERLCVTLRFLATGDSQTTISRSYRISQSTIGRVIPETSKAIWDVLLENGYLDVPKNENEWLEIANEFEERWNFPHCVGALDGKHVVMQAPNNSGSLFFNYKKTFSIVLFAVCDANYSFTMVDIGEAGRQSDGGIFNNSNFGYSITNNLLNLPTACALPRTSINFPYVFIGDDAFPLRCNLIKPYSSNKLERKQLIANYRICRARRIIENTFGIMASRFRVFRRPIIANVRTVESITKACVALHNYLMKNCNRDKNIYCPSGYIDYEKNNQVIKGSWRRVIESDSGLYDLRRVGSNNYTKNAKEIRDTFCDYVNSTAGEVPWQNTMISVKRF